jgi:hypothetical protein
MGTTIKEPLAIQKFLRSCDPRGALERAAEKWSLNVREFGNLAQLDYRIFNSPSGVQEVEECRGLILEMPAWNIVAFPFYRFYNATEPCAEKIALKDAMLCEKLDGTLIFAYPYQGEMHVATRGSITADGPVGENNVTFADYFWRTVAKVCRPHLQTAASWASSWVSDYCLIFELTGPLNRVVTPYQQDGLTLLGARSVHDWNECAPGALDNYAAELGVSRPQVYSFTDWDHIHNMLKMLKSLDEGYVLVDYNHTTHDHSFRRVKVKNPQYLVVARFLGNNFTDKNILSVVLEGDAAEVLAYFPEFGKTFDRVEMAVLELSEQLEAEHAALREQWPVIEPSQRREFAAHVKSTYMCWDYHFRRYDGQVDSALDWMRSMCPVSSKDGSLVVDKLYELLLKTTLK